MYINLKDILKENLNSLETKIKEPFVKYGVKNKTINYKFFVILSLIFIIGIFTLTTGAIAVFKMFTVGYSDPGLDNLRQGQYNSFQSLSCKSNGITLYAKAIVSDTSRTVVQIQVTGKLSGNGIPDLSGITLEDKEGNSYLLSKWGSGESNSNANFDQTSIEFNGGPEKETIVALSISKINGVDGNWLINIPIKPVTSEGTFNCNVIYNFDDGISFKIDKVTFTATQTTFHGTYSNYFRIDGYGPIHSTLLIDNKNKIDQIQYGGNSKEFTITTPPVNKNDKISLKFCVGIDDTSSITKDIVFEK
jgi:hypothetical protein